MSAAKMAFHVLNGNYPEVKLRRMSGEQLEQLVLRLINLTMLEARAKKLATVRCRPEWWPRDVLIREQELASKVGDKQFKEKMLRLILECSNFSREIRFSLDMSSVYHKWAWINDENMGVTKTYKTRNSEYKCKGRNALRSENNINLRQDALKKVSDVNFNSENLESVEKQPMKQATFLKLLSLGSRGEVAPTKVSSNPLRSQRLHNCPIVPLSSDLGKAIMKREEYNVPPEVIQYKLERTERFLNKVLPSHTEVKFRVSFAPKMKNFDYRTYPYPKGRASQKRRNALYQLFVLKMLKPLSVRITRTDLNSKRKRVNTPRLMVKITRLSNL